MNEQEINQWQSIITIVNIVAVISSPILAVLIAQWLQKKAQIRNDKMHIFKTLMTSRIYGWTFESVNCLNVIDIVFAEDKKVRSAWKELHDKYAVEKPSNTDLQKISMARDKLIEAIAISLGYKDKVTWETIQNPYIPVGMSAHLLQKENTENNMAGALELFLQMLLNNQQPTPSQEEQNSNDVGSE